MTNQPTTFDALVYVDLVDFSVFVVRTPCISWVQLVAASQPHGVYRGYFSMVLGTKVAAKSFGTHGAPIGPCHLALCIRKFFAATFVGSVKSVPVITRT